MDFTPFLSLPNFLWKDYIGEYLDADDLHNLALVSKGYRQRIEEIFDQIIHQSTIYIQELVINIGLSSRVHQFSRSNEFGLPDKIDIVILRMSSENPPKVRKFTGTHYLREHRVNSAQVLKTIQGVDRMAERLYETIEKVKKAYYFLELRFAINGSLTNIPNEIEYFHPIFSRIIDELPMVTGNVTIFCQPTEIWNFRPDLFLDYLFSPSRQFCFCCLHTMGLENEEIAVADREIRRYIDELIPKLVDKQREFGDKSRFLSSEFARDRMQVPFCQTYIGPKSGILRDNHKMEDLQTLFVFSAPTEHDLPKIF